MVFDFLVCFVSQSYQTTAFEAYVEIVFLLDDGRHFASFFYFVFQIGDVVALSVAEVVFVEGAGLIDEIGLTFQDESMLQPVILKRLFRSQCHTLFRMVQTVAASVVSGNEYPEQVVGVDGHGQNLVEVYGRSVQQEELPVFLSVVVQVSVVF